MSEARENITPAERQAELAEFFITLPRAIKQTDQVKDHVKRDKDLEEKLRDADVTDQLKEYIRMAFFRHFSKSVLGVEIPLSPANELFFLHYPEGIFGSQEVRMDIERQAFRLKQQALSGLSRATDSLLRQSNVDEGASFAARKEAWETGFFNRYHQQL